MGPRAEAAKHVIRIGLGLGLFFYGIALLVGGEGVESLFTLPLALLLGIGAALCFLPYLVAPVVGWFQALFLPSGKRIRLRHEFSRARALVQAGDGEAAVERLRQEIREHPERAQAARALMAEVQYEFLDRPEDALATIREAMAAGEWSEDLEKMARLGADILLEGGRTQEARSLLEEGASLAGSSAAAQRLRERRRGLRKDGSRQGRAGRAESGDAKR